MTAGDTESRWKPVRRRGVGCFSSQTTVLGEVSFLEPAGEREKVREQQPTLCLQQMLPRGDVAHLALPLGLASRPLAPRGCRIERCRPCWAGDRGAEAQPSRVA